MDIFDTDSLKADIEREKKAEDSAVESCHIWCVAALNGFLKAAQKVGTPIAELDMESDAARGSTGRNDLIPNWRTAVEGGAKVAKYYPIVRDTGWPGVVADGQGLTLDVDGRIYLAGGESNAEAAAAWICRITDNSLDTAKGVFDSALRGKPIAVDSRCFA